MKHLLLVIVIFLLSLSFVSCGKKRQNSLTPQKKETSQKVDTLKRFVEKNGVKDNVEYFDTKALLELNRILSAHTKDIKVQMIGTKTDRILARLSFHITINNKQMDANINIIVSPSMLLFEISGKASGVSQKEIDQKFANFNSKKEEKDGIIFESKKESSKKIVGTILGSDRFFKISCNFIMENNSAKGVIDGYAKGHFQLINKKDIKDLSKAIKSLHQNKKLLPGSMINEALKSVGDKFSNI